MKLDLQNMDGITFQIKAVYTDDSHNASTTRHGKKKPHIEVIDGPVKKINDTTFRFYPYEAGWDNARRSFNCWLVAVADADDEYKGAGAALTAGRWFVGGLNATAKPLALTLDLPMFAGKTVTYITDQPKKKGEKFFTSVKKTLKVGKDGKAKVVIQPNGGIIIE